MKHELKLKISSFLGCKFLNFVGKTIKWKIIGDEEFKRFKEKNESAILTTWHGRVFVPVYCLRNQNIYGIVSPSRDGEYLAQIFSHFGYKTIRGSTKRKGVSALLSAIRILKEKNFLAITPDGPRGPKEKVQKGIIYLSSITNIPIIPVGASCQHKKFLNTWDNSLLPLPFGKGVVIFGKTISLPEKINLEEMDYYANILEKEINNLNHLADEIMKEKK